jgi:hypothetical protein
MNIYHVSWTYLDRFAMNAALVAESADSAISLLDLDIYNCTDLKAVVIGTSSEEFKEEAIIAHECL